MTNEKPLTMHRLIAESFATAEEKGWHRLSTTIGDRLCLVHSEISEALEEIRNGRHACDVYYEQAANNTKKPCGFPIELADAVIRICDLAMVYAVDLEAALVEKLAYNKTRPMLHGGKRL